MDLKKRPNWAIQKCEQKADWNICTNMGIFDAVSYGWQKPRTHDVKNTMNTNRERERKKYSGKMA